MNTSIIGLFRFNQRERHRCRPSRALRALKGYDVKRIVFIGVMVVLGSRLFAFGDPPDPPPRDVVYQAILNGGKPQLQYVNSIYEKNEKGNTVVYLSIPLSIRWSQVGSYYKAGGITPHQAWFGYYVIEVYRIRGNSSSVIKRYTVSPINRTNIDITFNDHERSQLQRGDYLQIGIYSKYTYKDNWDNYEYPKSYTAFSQSYKVDAWAPAPPTNLRIDLGLSGRPGSSRGPGWYRNPADSSLYIKHMDHLPLRWTNSGGDGPHGSGVRRHILDHYTAYSSIPHLADFFSWMLTAGWVPVNDGQSIPPASQYHATGRFAPNMGLPSGRYKLRIRSEDNVNHISSWGPEAEVILDTESPDAVSRASISHHYTSGPNDTYDLHFTWTPSAGDRPAGSDGSGIYQYRFVFYNEAGRHLRGSDRFLGASSLRSSGDDTVTTKIKADVAGTLGLGNTYSVVVRTSDNVGNVSGSEPYRFTVALDPGKGLSVDSDSMSISGNASSPDGYSVPVNVSVPIPRANSFRLYRDRLDDKGTAGSTGIGGSLEVNYPVGNGIAAGSVITDSVPLSWAHRRIRYRLTDSQGRNILVSNTVQLPNIPANLGFRFKNGTDVQFEFPGSRETGSAASPPLRGAGTLTDTITVEPYSGSIVRRGGRTLDSEGDEVTYEIQYRYNSSVLSTGAVSALDSVNWRSEIERHRGAVEEGTLVIDSITVTESSAGFRYSKVYEAAEGRFDIAIDFDSTGPSSGGDSAFEIFRGSDTGLERALSEERPTNEISVLVSNLTFSDQRSGIAGYLFWSTEGTRESTPPAPSEWTEVEAPLLSRDARFDLSGREGPVFLNLQGAAGWFDRKQRPISGNQVIRYDLSGPSANPPPNGEPRRLHVAAVDAAGNSTTASVSTRLDTAAPQAPRGIRNSSFQENPGIGGYSFSLDWDDVPSAAEYGIRVLSGDGAELASAGSSVSALNDLALAHLGPDTTLGIHLTARDAAGNSSEAVQYVVHTPPRPMRVISADITHLETGRKRIDLAFAGESSGRAAGRLTHADESLGFTWRDEEKTLSLVPVLPRSDVSVELFVVGRTPRLLDARGVLIPGDWFAEPERTAISIGAVAAIDHDNRKLTLRGFPEDPRRLGITLLNAPPGAPEIISPLRAARGEDLVLNWNPSQDDDADELGYTVQMRLRGGTFRTLEFPNGGSRDTETADTSLSLSEVTNGFTMTHGQRYEWKVITRDYIRHPVNGRVPASEVSSSIAAFTVDNIPPVLGFPESSRELFTSDTSIELRIEEDGSSLTEVDSQPVVTLSVDGGAVQTLTAVPEGTENGKALYRAVISLEEGEHRYRVTARDIAGGQGEHTQVLRRDVTAPRLMNLEIDLPLTEGTFYSASSSIGVNARLQDDYSGVKELKYGWSAGRTTPPGEFAVLPLSHGALPAGDSSEKTFSRLRLSFTGEERISQYLWVKAADWAGNESETASVSASPVYVDTEFPDVNVSWEGIENSSGRFFLRDASSLKSAVVIGGDAAGAERTELFSVLYGIEELGEDPGTPGILWFPGVQSLGDSGVFESGRSYRLGVKVSSIVGTRRVFHTSPFIFDDSPPRDITVKLSPGGTLAPGAPLIAAVTGIDGESGIAGYRIALGSSPGTAEISSAVDGNSGGQLDIAGGEDAQLRFSVPSGFSGPVYITVRARDFAGNTAEISPGTPGFTIDPSIQSIAVRDSGQWFTDPEKLSARWEMIGGDAPARWSYRVLRDDSQIIDWSDTELGYAEVDVSQWALEGARYSWEVRGVFAGAALSAPGKSPGAVLDLTSPVVNTSDDSAVPSYSRSDSLRMNWDITERGSGLERVQLLIRRYEQGVLVPVGGWRTLGSGSGALSGGNVPVSLPEGLDGHHLYLTLRAADRAGHLTEFTPRPVLIDDTPPPAPAVADQGDFLNTRYAPDFHWLWGGGDTGSPVSYRWSLNSSPMPPDNAVWYADNGERIVSIGGDGVLDPPFETGALQQGRSWYLAVKAADAAGNESLGISNGIVMDGTAPLLAAVSILDNQGNRARYTDSLSGLSALVNADDDLGTEAVRGYDFLTGILTPSGNFQPDDESITAAVNRTALTISGRNPGEVLMLRGRATNAAGLSAQGLSRGTLYEPGYPAITRIGAMSSGARLVFDWQGTANGSPIRGYEAALKSASGGTPQEADWIDLGGARSTSYTSSHLPESSGGYRLYVRAVSESGRKSRGIEEEWGVSPVVFLDTTPPRITSFIHDRFTSHRLNFSVSAADSGGIAEYRYTLGTRDDAFAYTGGWRGEFSAAGLFTGNLSYSELSRALPRDGASVILRVRAKDRSGNWSSIAASDLIIADQTPPSTPVVMSGAWNTARNHVDGVDVSARDEQSGIVAYRWTVLPGESCIDAVESEDTVYAEAGQRLSFTLSDENLYGVNLEESSGYRAAFQVVNGSGLSSDVGCSEIFTVDSTPPRVIFTNIDSPAESGTEEGIPRIVHNGGELELPYTISEGLESLSFDLLKPDGTSERLSRDAPFDRGGVYRFDESDYGVYRISARPVDAAGNMGSGVREVRVNAPPVIRFPSIETASNRPLLLDMVQITDPEGDEPFTYRWSFGDSSPDSREAAPTHTYRHSAPGRSRSTYRVTLRVRDAHGKEGSGSAVVNVVNTRSGVLHDDEYWSGEHFVDGPVIVPSGVTLTLRRGAVMKMAVSDGDTSAGITVNGRIIAEGSAFFVPARDSGEYWEGIRLNAGGSRLNGVTIRGARRGITVNRGLRFSIADADFESNLIGIHAYGSRLSILRGTFIGNITYGIKEDADASVSIRESRFRGNGAAYYHRSRTVMSIDELNAQNGSSGNTGEVQ